MYVDKQITKRKEQKGKQKKLTRANQSVSVKKVFIYKRNSLYLC